MHIQSKLLQHTPVMGTHSIMNWAVCLGLVTILEVSVKEEGVIALHLPIGPLKTFSEFEPVPRCEPSTYHPISL